MIISSIESPSAHSVDVAVLTDMTAANQKRLSGDAAAFNERRLVELTTVELGILLLLLLLCYICLRNLSETRRLAMSQQAIATMEDSAAGISPGCEAANCGASVIVRRPERQVAATIADVRPAAVPAQRRSQTFDPLIGR